MKSLALICAAAALLFACAKPLGPFVWAHDYKSERAAHGEYVIVPGDVLSVRVYQQDAASSRVRVRADGRISLPLVGEIDAAGKSPQSLGKELEEKFRAFLTTPNVIVSVEETRPLSVSVLGEVARPGSYTLDPSAGVLEALASAGGLNEFAHTDRIFVLRKESAERASRIRFTFEELAHAAPQTARFRLVPGDVVVVE